MSSGRASCWRSPVPPPTPTAPRSRRYASSPTMSSPTASAKSTRRPRVQGWRATAGAQRWVEAGRRGCNSAAFTPSLSSCALGQPRHHPSMSAPRIFARPAWARTSLIPSTRVHAGGRRAVGGLAPSGACRSPRHRYGHQHQPGRLCRIPAVRRAVVPEAADGQSADGSGSLPPPPLFLKAGPAGGRLQRPSSAGTIRRERGGRPNTPAVDRALHGCWAACRW
jgi:hypothetical protein